MRIAVGLDKNELTYLIDLLDMLAIEPHAIALLSKLKTAAENLEYASESND
jgi:hypothetical protein